MVSDISFQALQYLASSHIFPCMKLHHFVQSPCSLTALHKGVQHLLDMNQNFPKQWTAVQSTLKEVIEEGQHYVRMESFQYLISLNMVFLKERVGVSICKASYIA